MSESWRSLPPETEVPEWVQVWKWMRGHGDFRSLPQQERPARVIDPEDARPVKADLTMDQYEIAHAQWMKAGSPKASFREIVGQVTA